jgi:hypothetical protein
MLVETRVEIWEGTLELKPHLKHPCPLPNLSPTLPCFKGRMKVGVESSGPGRGSKSQRMSQVVTRTLSSIPSLCI